MKFSVVLLAGLVFLFGAVGFLRAEGSVTMTTYFPAAEVNYQDVSVTNQFVVPAKAVGGDPSAVRAGEIWLES